MRGQKLMMLVTAFFLQGFTAVYLDNCQEHKSLLAFTIGSSTVLLFLLVGMEYYQLEQNEKKEENHTLKI